MTAHLTEWQVDSLLQYKYLQCKPFFCKNIKIKKSIKKKEKKQKK